MTAIFRDALTFEEPVTFSDTVDLSDATITLPVTSPLPLRYVSQLIVHGDLTGGSASCTVSLNSFPNGAIPTAAYLKTTVAVTSSSGNTTGLTAKVGITGVDDDGFLTSTSIFGAAGRKLAPAGAQINGYVAGSASVTFTATGGTPDVGHIDALGLYVVVYYHLPVAEA